MLLLPACLAVCAMMQPAVVIEVDADPGVDPTHARAVELEALLTWRMLDDGIRVVGDADSAQIELNVRLHPEVAEVIVLAGRQRVEQVGSEPKGTFEFELSQVASILVDELRDELDVPPELDARTLGLELSEASVDPAAMAFREALLFELLDRGWALTTERGPGHARVCIEDRNATTLISVAAPSHECHETSSSSGRFVLGDGAGAHTIEVASALIEQGLAPPTTAMARARPEDTPSLHGEALEALGPPTPPAMEVRKPARRRRFALHIQPEVDAMVRWGVWNDGAVVVDPMPRITVQLGPSPGITGRLGVAFVPAGGPARSRAFDSFAGVGFGWQRVVAGGARVDLGALAGVSVHDFHAGQPARPGTFEDRRSSSPWTELALGVGWEIGSRLGLHLQLRGGTSLGRGWVHVVDYRRFQRSSWYLASGFGLSWTWSKRS